MNTEHANAADGRYMEDKCNKGIRPRDSNGCNQ